MTHQVLLRARAIETQCYVGAAAQVRLSVLLRCPPCLPGSVGHSVGEGAPKMLKQLVCPRLHYRLLTLCPGARRGQTSCARARAHTRAHTHTHTHTHPPTYPHTHTHTHTTHIPAPTPTHPHPPNHTPTHPPTHTHTHSTEGTMTSGRATGTPY